MMNNILEKRENMNVPENRTSRKPYRFASQYNNIQR